LTVQP
ncbi:DNA-directed RNA polymerase 7 kDa subunit, partial [Monkeypox virus]